MPSLGIAIVIGAGWAVLERVIETPADGIYRLKGNTDWALVLTDRRLEEEHERLEDLRQKLECVQSMLVESQTVSNPPHRYGNNPDGGNSPAAVHPDRHDLIEGRRQVNSTSASRFSVHRRTHRFKELSSINDILGRVIADRAADYEELQSLRNRFAENSLFLDQVTNLLRGMESSETTEEVASRITHRIVEDMADLRRALDLGDRSAEAETDHSSESAHSTIVGGFPQTGAGQSRIGY
jgi:hypothetical protein